MDTRAQSARGLHSYLSPESDSPRVINEGFTHEEQWVNVLLYTEGEARVYNDTLKPRLKAEVLMEV